MDKLGILCSLWVAVIMFKLNKNRRNNLRTDFKSSYWEKKENETVTE